MRALQPVAQAGGELVQAAVAPFRVQFSRVARPIEHHDTEPGFKPGGDLALQCHHVSKAGAVRQAGDAVAAHGFLQIHGRGHLLGSGRRQPVRRCRSYTAQ